MDSFCSSVETNTNMIKDIDERRDMGHEFLAKSVDDSKSDKPVEPINHFIYNPSYVHFGQPFVTAEGFISLFLTKDIRVDINTNHSICVTTAELKLSVDSMAHNIGVIHPFGRIYHELDQNCVHIDSGVHLAKMCGRGVTFTSLNRTLVYLVDTSGCKTTTERFRKLSYDFTADIFNANSLTGYSARQRAFAELFRHTYELSEDGSDKIWFLSGFKVRHNLVTEDLVITKTYGKLTIHLSLSKNQFQINSPKLRIALNNKSENCLQIIRPDPRNEQRVITSFERFQVKNGSQKAGFDAKDQLVLM